MGALAHCKSCNNEKPQSDFYKGHINAAGTSGKCKDCHNAAMAEWRIANPSKVKDYRQACKQRTKDRRARQNRA